MRTRADLARFVESLPIPAERREVVLLELEDHVFGEMAEREAAGATPAEAERAALASLGLVDLRAKLVRANADFAPFGRHEAGWTGIRIGLSFALAIYLMAVATDVAEIFWWRLGVGNGNAQWFMPLVYALLTVPLVAHYLLLRPWRLARRVQRLEDPVAFFLLVSLCAVISAAPIELSAYFMRSSYLLFGLWPQLGDPVYGLIFLTMWLGNVLWLCGVVFIALAWDRPRKKAPDAHA